MTNPAYTHQAIISVDAPPRSACGGAGRSVARAADMTCPDCLSLAAERSARVAEAEVHDAHAIPAGDEPVSHIAAFLALDPQPGQVFTDRHDRPWFVVDKDCASHLWLITAAGRQLTPGEACSRYGPLTRAQIVPADEYAPGTVLVDRDDDEWRVIGRHTVLMEGPHDHPEYIRTLDHVRDTYGPLTVKAEEGDK